MTNKYNEDYYMRGVETGVSNYTNYSWQEEKTMALGKRIIEVLGIKPGDTLLDYGTARGFVVKALCRLGVDAWGYDISEWAVQNCDPEVKHRVFNEIKHKHYDYVWMKDLAEHLTPDEFQNMMGDLLPMVKKKMMIIIPLAAFATGDYVREEDRKDVTHIIRATLEDWMELIHWSSGAEDFTITGSWHIPGLKPTSQSAFQSCGFIEISRNRAS